MVELQKSLHTKEFSEARHLCLLATNWFHAAMEQMREMPSPTKADLEVAARNFFEKLRRDIDVPRNFPPDQIREAVHMNTVLAEDDIRALDRQLIANEFEPHVQNQTARMLGDVGLSDSDLPADLALEANRLAARALREHMRYFIHQLERPHRVYVPEDEAFLERQQLGHSSSTGVEVVARPTAIEAKTLSATVADFLAAKVKQGVGPSQIEEMSRLFRWLKEEVGSETSLAEIGAAQLRQFKDNLARIDVTLRGRNSLFKDRLTDDPGKQAKSATYGKYLASLKAFFSWCMSEGTIHRDPAASLEFLIPKSEPKNTPEAFSKAELLVLTRTPLYSGYRSLKHLTDGRRLPRGDAGKTHRPERARGGVLRMSGSREHSGNIGVSFDARPTHQAPHRASPRPRREHSLLHDHVRQPQPPAPLLRALRGPGVPWRERGV